ncbi:hypothetical protein F3087_25570 [Nocardia colli]|uniref:Uncharacterized protein n=1 Tax=Nocardia colli TaxID=2545717 RepID=A0A5N0ECQ7_9NOCA|nr:hypothetical protein [Nocardia colli]KAA8885994.1 hypothetical protein F3087_25570 [Nocardia colli]
MTSLILGVLAATALALIEFGPHQAATRQSTRTNRAAAHGIAGDFVRGSREGARQALPEHRQSTRTNRAAAHGIAGDFARGSRKGARLARREGR